MDEDEILEEEESLAGESPNYVKFEDIAGTDQFQSADVDRQLEIIDNLHNHNRDQVAWGMTMVDELNRLEGESQLQKRLLIARDSSKNGEDWSKDLYKQQYDAYARYYDSERDDVSFDELEQTISGTEQALSMGEKVLYLNPVKEGKDITYLDMGELGASVDDYKDAKNLVQQGEYVYLKTDNYYSNRSDGYVDPLMPEKRGKVRDAQTAEVIDEDGVLNNVTRLTPEQEVEYAENVMNTLADSTDEQSFDKLREMGATKQQIIKRVDMGMLSVNTGEYLMNTLYGESVMPTEFGSEDDFNKFLDDNEKQAELYNKAMTRHKVRNADDPLLAKPLAWLGNTVVDITGDDVDAAEIETLNNITKAYQRDWVMRNKGKAGVTRQDLIDVYGEDDLLKDEAGVTDWQQLKETWRSAIQNAFGSTVGIAGSLGGFIGRYDEETSEVADEMLRLNTLSAKEWGKGIYQNTRTLAGEAAEMDAQMNKSLAEWQNHYDNKPANMNDAEAAAWQAENQEYIDKLAASAFKRNKELFGDGAGTIEDYSLTESPELLAEAAAYASTADPDQVLRIQSILRVDPQTRGYREERDAWSEKMGMEGMNKLKAGYFGGTTAGWQELVVEVASAATGYIGAKAIVAAKSARKFNKISKVDPKRAWREHAIFDAQQATGKAKAMRIAGRGKYAAAIIPQTLAEGAEEGIVELGNPDITWDSFKHAVKQGMMGGAGLGLGVQMPLATYSAIKEDRSIEEHLGKLPDQVMGDERVAIMDKLRAARAEQTAEAVGETYNLNDAKSDVEGNMLDPENMDVKWIELSGRHEEAVEAYEQALEASKANPGDAALKEEMEAAYIYARITKDLFDDATTQMIAEGKLDVQDSEQKDSESQTPVSDAVPQADSPAADAANPRGKKLETDDAKKESAEGGFQQLDVDNLSESSATKLDNEQDENDWHDARDKYGISFEKKDVTRNAFRAAYQSISNDLQSNHPAVVEQAKKEARVIAQKQTKRADFYESQGDNKIAAFVRKEANSFTGLAGIEENNQQIADEIEQKVADEVAGVFPTDPGWTVDKYETKEEALDAANKAREGLSSFDKTNVGRTATGEKLSDAVRIVQMPDGTYEVHSTWSPEVSGENTRINAIKQAKQQPEQAPPVKKQYKLGRQPQPKRNVRDARGPEVIRSSQGNALATEGAAKRALTMASKDNVKVNIDNYDVVQITEGVDKGKWEVRRKPDENTGDAASAELGMPATKKTESTPKTDYTKLSATPKQDFVEYTTPTLKGDKTGEGKGMVEWDEGALDKDIAAGRTIRTDTLSERKRLGGAQVEIANNLINAGYNEVSDGVWEKRSVQKPVVKGQIDELNESHSGLNDIQKMGKRLLESKAGPNEEKTAMLTMMRAAAPGAEFSFTDDTPIAGATKIDAQHKVGGTILGITPYLNKDGTQADKYTLKVDPNWRQRLAKDVGAKDYESATPEQKQLIEQYFAKAIDEETAHVVVLQNTTLEQRTEMTKDLLNDKQAVSDLKSYFGTKKNLQRSKNESEVEHSNRIVAEWTNIVRQRALYGYSNSDFVNWVSKHSKKVVDFTRNLIGSLVKSLRTQQQTNYTPKVQAHLEKMEGIFSEMMGDKGKQESTQAADNVKGVNIYSRSESEVGRYLTNFAPAPMTFRGKEFVSSEHAYQTYKSGSYDGTAYARKGRRGKAKADQKNILSLMREVLQERMKQDPKMVEMIDQNGGVAFLEASSHKVTGRPNFWETSGSKRGGFMDALIDAYKAHKGESTAPTKATSETPIGALPSLGREESPIERANELLREVQSVHLDTIDGAVGVTGEGELVVRLPETVGAEGELEGELRENYTYSMMRDDVVTEVNKINNSKVYKRSLNTLAAYAKSDTSLSDVDSVYSHYSVASADLKTQMDTLTKMQEQLEEQKAGLLEVQEVVANEEIEDQRIKVERAYSEYLFAKWSMPRDFRQAYANVLSVSKLVQSAPSFDYLGERGFGLGSSLEAEMERAALRNRATEAVTPFMRYLQLYGLETRQVGSSSRNHAPSKALIYFNDGNPTLENLGYLMNPRQNAKIYITITPRMVADMIGLKQRINQYLDEADSGLTVWKAFTIARQHREDKLHAVLLRRIDAVLDSPVVRKMDKTEVQRYYDKDVRGKNNFGRSIFFLGKNDRVIVKDSVWSDAVVRNHEGKIEYSLHPDHLRQEKGKNKEGEFLFNELDAAAGRKRAADVRYTIGSGFAARARIAANRGVVNESTAKAIKAGDIWAPLTIAGDGTNAANPTKAHKDELYQRILNSIDTQPETNTKVSPLIPFPSIIGSNDMEVNWAKNIKAIFKRIVDQKLSSTKASLHPMSAYAGEILQLAQRHINKPSKYTRDNLVQRVRNISDLLGEVRKQMGNQEKSIKDVWVDTDMIADIANQIELGNVTNITPYELERMLDKRTSVDAATAVLFESGTSQEKFTNTDSILEQEEFNDSARIHGLNHNSTDEEAQAKRALMLAVLFYPDMQKAMDWASQFQSVKALDVGLFKRLDEATEEYLRFEDNYQRKQLSALMDGNAMARFTEGEEGGQVLVSMT
jgi:hypothetical protein